MQFNYMTWFKTTPIKWLILNYLIIYILHKNLYLKFDFKEYRSTQRIHLNEMPRLGGFTFIVCLTGLTFQSQINEESNLFILILSSLIPLIFIALKEDLFHNVQPVIRFLSLIFSGLK